MQLTFFQQNCFIYLKTIFFKCFWILISFVCASNLENLKYSCLGENAVSFSIQRSLSLKKKKLQRFHVMMTECLRECEVKEYQWFLNQNFNLFYFEGNCVSLQILHLQNSRVFPDPRHMKKIYFSRVKTSLPTQPCTHRRHLFFT